MINPLIIAGIISLLSAIIGAFIALKIQSRTLKRISIENEAWQHAHEAHQIIWEVKQRKQALEFEQKLTLQVQQIQEAWQRWESNDKERLARLTLEQKLALLPHIEDVSVPFNEHAQVAQTNPYGPQRQPPSFYKTNLSGQDLSRRYLACADLRETQLVNTNFYMADLSGACLTGANLAGANLAGANLTRADLRDAILTDANILVADLNEAVLDGANLLGAHNLTTEQIHSAIYNSKTQIDIECDLTPPGIANGHLTDLKPTTAPASIAFDSTIPTSRNTSKSRAKAQ
jgi:hypothetical protein